jgi:filamentous hemagglutinin
MANNIFIGSVSNDWGTSGNWSLNSVPTASDGNIVVFNASSPNCTVNSTARVANNIDFTGYTNTITMSNGLTVSGNVTLSSGMGINGSGGLIINANSTLTSNGKSWPNSLTISPIGAGSPITCTLADTWTTGGSLACGGVGAITITGGNSMYVGGSLSMGNSMASSSNATIVMNGTGTWAGAGQVHTNLTVDTLGTFTISGSVDYRSRTLKYISAGSTNTAGSTLTVSLNATLDIAGMPLYILTSSGGATVTLANDVYVNGQLSLGGVTINGTYSIYAAGGFANNSGNIAKGTGAPTIVMTGGTFTRSGSGTIQVNLTFNGNVTVTGTLAFGGATLKRLGGTITTTDSTLSVSGISTIDTTGISWYNVTTVAGSTLTLSTQLSVLGTLTLSQTIVNGSDIYINGNLTAAGTTSYTSTNTTLILQGTGTWSGNFPLGFNITFASTCNITVSGTVNHYGIGGKTIYAAPGATVNTAGSTLRLLGSGTNLHIINTASVVWENVILFSYNPSTFKLESDLNVGGDLITSYWTGAGPIIYMNGAGYNININGALTVGSALYSGTLDAGPTLKLLTKVGTFTWSGSPLIRLPMIINPTGTLNVSGTVTYGGNLNTSVLTYNNSNGGSVGTTGSTLYLLSSCTLNTNGISWNNVLLANSTVNYALTSDFITKNLTSGGGIQTFNTNNGSIVKVLNGTLTVGQNNGIEGNSTIVVEGTSSWISATSANCQLRINLILRPNGGVITVGNNGFPLSFNTKTITYDGSGGGSVSATGSTLNLNTSTILNTAGITWGTVNILNGTHTLNSLLTANTIGFGTVNNTVIFAGTAGWTVDTFTISVTGGARLIQLKQGITYTITTSATMIAQSSIIKLRFESAQTSGSKPLFNIQPGASQNISHVYPYRIDSSGGQTVYSANATIDAATVNWTNVAPSRGNFLLLFY